MWFERNLIRPRAWWFNKVPLSITLVMLLVDGHQADLAAAAALVLVVLTICAIGNYGYALNDLYDLEEDARAGRGNAAAKLGKKRIGWIVGISALCAEGLGIAAAGRWGGALTLAELALPMIYSLPPWRIKERKWLGVAADALAAHVYPAVLALMTVSRFGIRPLSNLLLACMLGWSAAVGIRGILSHQLHTSDRDRQAGLLTVVHDLGKVRLERFIMAVLVPIEVVGFIGAVAACDPGPVLLVLGVLYLAYEAFKTAAGGFTVNAFRAEGQAYLPIVEEIFYKAWGPIVVSLDAARVNPAFVLVAVAYLYLFAPHMRTEAIRLRLVWAALLRMIGHRAR